MKVFFFTLFLTLLSHSLAQVRWNRLSQIGSVPIFGIGSTLNLIGRDMISVGGYQPCFGDVNCQIVKRNDFQSYSLSGNGEWTVKHPSSIMPWRSFHSSANWEGANTIFFFGGVEMIGDVEIGQVFNDLWEYNPFTETLLKHEFNSFFSPCKRFGAKMWFSNQKLFLFGGWSENLQPLDDLWKYSIQAREWILLEVSPKPSARGEFLTSSDGKEAIIAGGLRQFYNFSSSPSDVWRFDFATERFIAINTEYFDLLPKTGAVAMITPNRRFVVSNGQVVDQRNCSTVIGDLNVERRMWSLNLVRSGQNFREIEAISAPFLFGAAFANQGNNLYVVGGLNYLCFAREEGVIWNSNLFRVFVNE